MYTSLASPPRGTLCVCVWVWMWVCGCVWVCVWVCVGVWVCVCAIGFHHTHSPRGGGKVEWLLLWEWEGGGASWLSWSSPRGTKHQNDQPPRPTTTMVGDGWVGGLHLSWGGGERACHCSCPGELRGEDSTRRHVRSRASSQALEPIHRRAKRSPFNFELLFTMVPLSRHCMWPFATLEADSRPRNQQQFNFKLYQCHFSWLQWCRYQGIALVAFRHRVAVEADSRPRNQQQFIISFPG